MAACAASTATGSGRSGAGAHSPCAERGAIRPRRAAALGGLPGLQPRARGAGPGGSAGCHRDIVARPGAAPHPDGVMGAPGRPDRKVDPVAAAAQAPRAPAPHVVCVKTGATGEHAPVLSHYRKGLI